MALLGERTKSSESRPCATRGHSQQSHYTTTFIGPQLPPAKGGGPAIGVGGGKESVDSNGNQCGRGGNDGGDHASTGKERATVDREPALLPQLEMKWGDIFNGRPCKSVPGLQNDATTCYMNSVLQCLSYTTPFANLCMKRQHTTACRSIFPVGGTKITCPFCLVENRICNHLFGEQRIQNPAAIINNLRIFAPTFSLRRQEDAHEFLQYMVEACNRACIRLHVATARRKAGPGFGGTSGGKQYAGNGRGGSGGVGALGGEEPHTVVREIFGGLEQSQLKCCRCSAESNRFAPFLDLSLELDGSLGTLEGAFRRYTQAEILDGDNRYNCDNCKQLSEARKQITLLSSPNILVIQLKRFAYLAPKLNYHVKFHERLALGDFMSPNTKDPTPEYMLYGVIVHQGASQDAGHYYAYVKDQRGFWFQCDDNRISPATLNEVLKEKAYILFYARTNTRPIGATLDIRCNGVAPPTNPAAPLKAPAPLPPLAPDSPSVVFATPALRPANGRAENAGPAKQSVRRGPLHSNGTSSLVNSSTPDSLASRSAVPPLQARPNGHTNVNGTVAKKAFTEDPSRTANGNGVTNGVTGASAAKPTVLGLSPDSFSKGLAQAEAEPFDEDSLPMLVQTNGNGSARVQSVVPHVSLPVAGGEPSQARRALVPRAVSRVAALQVVPGDGVPQTAGAHVPSERCNATVTAQAPAIVRSLFGAACAPPTAATCGASVGDDRREELSSAGAARCHRDEKTEETKWPPRWIALAATSKELTSVRQAEEEHIEVPTCTDKRIAATELDEVIAKGQQGKRGEESAVAVLPALPTLVQDKTIEAGIELSEQCCRQAESINDVETEVLVRKGVSTEVCGDEAAVAGRMEGLVEKSRSGEVRSDLGQDQEFGGTRGLQQNDQLAGATQSASSMEDEKEVARKRKEPEGNKDGGALSMKRPRVEVAVGVETETGVSVADKVVVGITASEGEDGVARTGSMEILQHPTREVDMPASEVGGSVELLLNVEEGGAMGLVEVGLSVVTEKESSMARVETEKGEEAGTPLEGLGAITSLVADVANQEPVLPVVVDFAIAEKAHRDCVERGGVGASGESCESNKAKPSMGAHEGGQASFVAPRLTQGKVVLVGRVEQTRKRPRERETKRDMISRIEEEATEMLRSCGWDARVREFVRRSRKTQRVSDGGGSTRGLEELVNELREQCRVKFEGMVPGKVENHVLREVEKWFLEKKERP